jgi:hypothetical protein
VAGQGVDTAGEQFSVLALDGLSGVSGTARWVAPLQPAIPRDTNSWSRHLRLSGVPTMARFAFAIDQGSGSIPSGSVAFIVDVSEFRGHEFVGTSFAQQVTTDCKDLTQGGNTGVSHIGFGTSAQGA